jgi:hypothetical protein
MVPCALLGADGACTVYAARPLACRGHHSFDVEACRLVFETRVDRKTAKRDTILLFADGAARGLRDALGELRLDGGTYELNQALAIALADPTAASRWRAGEDAFAEARAVLPDEEARALTEGRATPRT